MFISLDNKNEMIVWDLGIQLLNFDYELLFIKMNKKELLSLSLKDTFQDYDSLETLCLKGFRILKMRGKTL